MAFKPALLVVDMQNEFCSPPRGTNLISGNGMDLVAPIKQLLSMPGFALRVATKHELAESHKCLSHNHKGAKAHETHGCIKESWGAQLVDGLQESDFDFVVRRNGHDNVLMYSAIKDLHGNDKHNLPEGAVSHHLADELASNNITDVFCVGTAGDLCVSHTAMDVASAGFKAYVVEDVTKSFDAGKGWPAMKKELKAKGVEVVTLDGPEVGKVKALKGNGLGDDEKSGKQPAMTMVFKGNFNGPVFFGYAADQAKALMQTA